MIEVQVIKNTASSALRELLRKFGMFEVPLTEMGRNLVTSTRHRFRLSEGPALGTGAVKKWAPLRPKTIARRRKRSSRPLLDTATLLRTVQARVSKNELHVGTNHYIAPGVTAAIHQLGGLPSMKPGPAAVPAREFLGIDERDRKMLEHVAAEYLGSS